MPDLDEAIDFYTALGFRRTYRQLRPNPYAVVQRDEITVHLAGIDGFDPETSVSSVIVTVPDADAVHAAFATGLRERYGRLPVAGIPRILRPRRKAGTTTGFSVVDVGGNWLRFYRAGDSEADASSSSSSGLARALEVAARQGDARGDEAQALVVLDAALARHPGAPAVEQVPVLVYKAELLVRLGRHGDATATAGLIRSLDLGPDRTPAVAADLAHLEELLGGS